MSETYRVTAPGHALDGVLVTRVGENPDTDSFSSMIFGPSSEYRINEVTPEIQAAFDEAFEGQEIPEHVDIQRVYFYDDEVELVEAAA